MWAPLAWRTEARCHPLAANTAAAARLGVAFCMFDVERKRNTRMAHLGTVLEDLGLEGEVSPLGRWARLRGERGTVYVAHAAFGSGYYSWCDTPQEHTPHPYLDPAEAIQAALRRATHSR
jgi:hypothetical protein